MLRVEWCCSSSPRCRWHTSSPVDGRGRLYCTDGSAGGRLDYYSAAETIDFHGTVFRLPRRSGSRSAILSSSKMRFALFSIAAKKGLMSGYMYRSSADRGVGDLARVEAFALNDTLAEDKPPRQFCDCSPSALAAYTVWNIASDDPTCTAERARQDTPVRAHS